LTAKAEAARKAAIGVLITLQQPTKPNLDNENFDQIQDALDDLQLSVPKPPKEDLRTRLARKYYFKQLKAIPKKEWKRLAEALQSKANSRRQQRHAALTSEPSVRTSRCPTPGDEPPQSQAATPRALRQRRPAT
jgi:hypothetical protein